MPGVFNEEKKASVIIIIIIIINHHRMPVSYSVHVQIFAMPIKINTYAQKN
jgi:hypothetical protein